MQETEYYEEREIDLIDLLIEVLSHWRGMIIALVIGAVAAGGYSYISSGRQAEEAAREMASETKEYYEEALTEVQRRLVETVILCEAELEAYQTEYPALGAEMDPGVRLESLTYMIQLRQTIKNTVNAFSGDEYGYYEMIREEESEELPALEEEGTESVSEEASIPEAAQGTPDIKGTLSKKYVAIGALAGIFLVAFWQCYRYVVDRRLKDSDSLSRLYGVPELGTVPASERAHGKHKKSGIDRKLQAWKRRGRKTLPEAEALRVAAAETASVCGVNGTKRLAIIGAENAENSKVASALCEALGRAGITADSLGNILYNADNLAKISEYDGAVLLETFRESEYEEIENRIGALKRQKVRILGGILVW